MLDCSVGNRYRRLLGSGYWDYPICRSGQVAAAACNPVPLQKSDSQCRCRTTAAP
ncbi:hypothetical protein [Listeria monocytogenes]|uniref:hypothetical protein n=1 Tax=Listeria monocytogenes TaxID=1639 RepID=UPI002FDC7244